MLPSTKPLVRRVPPGPGPAKRQTTRYLAACSRSRLKVVVVRHPMPYGDLVAHGSPSATHLRRPRTATITTIEEREEYEPHLDAGRVLYAGVDYEAILRQAETEAGRRPVGRWQQTISRSTGPTCSRRRRPRSGPAMRMHYHPAETKHPHGDVVVINKVEFGNAGAGWRGESQRRVDERPCPSDSGPVCAHACRRPKRRHGKAGGRRRGPVPTLTHGGGGNTYGAGSSRRGGFGPRRCRSGPVRRRRTGRDAPPLPESRAPSPAMGYGQGQNARARDDPQRHAADLVLSATPMDLTRVLSWRSPSFRVRYELEELAGDAAGHEQSNLTETPCSDRLSGTCQFDVGSAPLAGDPS